MKKLLTLFLFLFSTATYSFAQLFIVSGIIKDNAGKAVATATVSLVKASDSSWIASACTDDKGKFAFKNIAPGEYMLNIAATGYIYAKKKITVVGDLAAVEISINKTNKLQEVTVTDKKPFIEQQLGKTVVNVSQSVSTAGNSVLDLLRKSPGVSVDANGNISLAGKQGVLILIDDKQTYLSGQQLSDYLRNLSAEQVAQLELITQPSAKYDAEGGGIINIKTKKNRRQGINGVANMSYMQGFYPGTINSISLEQTKGRLHLEGRYGLLHNTNFESYNGYRNILDDQNRIISHFEENGFLRETYEDHNLKLGVDYKLSDKTSFNASITGIYHTNSEDDNVATGLTDSNNIYTYTSALTKTGFIRRNILADAGYKHDFSKNNSLSVNADYLLRNENTFANAINTNYNAQMLQIPGGDIYLAGNLSLINAATVRADYTKQLDNGIKIETGIKTSYSAINDDVKFRTLQNGIFIPDTGRSNDFMFKENISALYITANKNFGKKWETQLGLRCENDITSGIEEIHQRSFNNNTTSLFPTAFIAYTLNKNNRFEANFGRRVTRPPYTWLNPFTRYLSQYSYEQGNPQLQPEYSNNVELKHTYKNRFTTTCTYSRTSGLFTDAYYVNGNVEFKRIQNIARSEEWAMLISYTEPVCKWLSLAATAHYYYNIFKGQINGADFNVMGSQYTLHLDSQFTFSHGLSAEALYHFWSGGPEGFMIYEERRQWMSFAFAKRLFRDTTVIKLNFDDPFKLYSYIPVNNSYNINSRMVNRWDDKHVNISLTYNFGKATIKHSDNALPDEAGRMGM